MEGEQGEVPQQKAEATKPEKPQILLKDKPPVKMSAREKLARIAAGATTLLSSIASPGDQERNIDQEALNVLSNRPAITESGEFPKPPQEFQMDDQIEKGTLPYVVIVPNTDSEEKQKVPIAIQMMDPFTLSPEEINIYIKETGDTETDNIRLAQKAAEAKRQRILETLRINKIAKETSPNSAIIDYEFRNNPPGEKMVVNPASEDELLKKLLKEDYISSQDLEKEFGSNFKSNIKTIAGKYPKVAAAYAFLGRYNDHGGRVGQAEEAVLKIFGFNRKETDFYPLQNTITPDKIQLISDELGNVSYLIDITPESVIQAVKEIKNSHPEKTRFNLSIHVGDQRFYYITKERVESEPFYIEIEDPKRPDVILYFPIPKGVEIKGYIVKNDICTPVTQEGKILESLTEEEWKKYKEENRVKEVDLDLPKVKEEDAYTPEKAKENLPKLFQVANAFPDILFFAAAGNNIDDLRGLKEQQPKNLITVAQWYSYENRPMGKVDGADIYVDNDFFGLGSGSSFSTPAISAIADILESRGYNNDQIRETLFAACETKTYNRNGEIFEARVFNPTKLNLNSSS